MICTRTKVYADKIMQPEIRNNVFDQFQDSKLKYLIFICTAGTFFEWVNYTMYGLLINIMKDNFFYASSSIPSPEEAFIALLWTWLGFGVGYLFKPLGALLFGYIGDTKGRAFSMYWSLMLMGLSTACIGFIPAIDQIGIFSPIMLMLCRIAQGVAIAGGQSGATILLLEQYKGQDKNLLASFVNFANSFGIIGGSVVALIVKIPGMPSYSWRLAMMLGLLTCVLAQSMYKNFDPKELDSKLQKKEEHSSFTSHIAETYKHEFSGITRIFMISAIVSTYYNVCNTWWRSWSLSVGVSGFEADFYGTIGICCVAIIGILSGLMADKVGTKNQILLGLSLCLVGGPLVLYFTVQGYPFLSQLAYAIPYGIFSPLAKKFANDMVKNAKYRYTALSTSWNIASAVFGGLSPLAAVYINEVFGLQYISIALMLVVMATIYSVMTSDSRS